MAASPHLVPRQMLPLLRYPVPAGRHRVEQSIDRSRFICTLAPATTHEEAQRMVRTVAEEMPDANHHCWAILVGGPGNTSGIGSSDDGEPRGTAGRPMLVALLHSGIGDVVAVVTRYFGGIKLGTGGLARAYGGTVQLALGSMPRTEHVALTPCSLAVSYPQVDVVKQLLARHGVTVVAQRYEADVQLQLKVPTDRLSQVREAVRDGTRGLAELRVASVDDRSAQTSRAHAREGPVCHGSDDETT
ncbi:MAG: YigZ family protein [Gemmatimonadota bacterium]